MASWRTVLSLVVAVAASGCGTHGAPPARAAVIPPITVRTLDSSETQLAAALKGRPALVNLWATWCDACRDELPALRSVDAWARERGAVVVAVAVGEPLAHVSSFAASNRLPYLVLVDEELELADALGERRVPATLVVDKEGRIVYAGGAVDDRSLSALEKLVSAGAPVAAARPTLAR